jgi:hypothetical protein
MRGGFADLLAAAYADGLRDVFLACGAAGIAGALLVLWLVRSAPPEGSADDAPGQREAAPAAR